jgi:16S rRNA pseudouridine516 synthase
VEEGKYHQVKRMFGARGNRVVYLKRLSMGPLQLGNLPLGEARALTIDEVAALYAVVGLPLPV